MKGQRVRQGHKTFLVWVMLIFAFFVVYQFLSGNRPDDHRVAFSLFMQDVEQHPEKFKAGASIQIRKTQDAAEFRGQLASGEGFTTTGLISDKVLDRLDKAHLNYDVVKEQ